MPPSFVSTIQRLLPWLAFVASLGLLAIGWIVRGDISYALRPDTGKFLEAGESFLLFLSGNVEFAAISGYDVFPSYFISCVWLAAFHVFMEEPVLGTVIANCVLFALIVAGMFRFWGRFLDFGENSARLLPVAMAGGLYLVLGLPDAFLWAYTVLTDTIFLFWLAVFMFAMAPGMLGGSRRWWWLALVMAGAAPFVRPTGVLLPLLLCYGVLIRFLVDRGTGPGAIAATSFAVVVAVGMVLVPWLAAMKMEGRDWVDAVIPDVFQREFNVSMYFFRRGETVGSRLETHIENPSGYLDLLKMVATRLAYYWVPLRFGEPPYSVAHNLVNLVYVLVAWPLAIAGVTRLMRMDAAHRGLLVFLLVACLSYAMLHAVTFLSFDWRYQLPGLIPFWMLGGIGWYTLVARWMGPAANAAPRSGA